MGGVVPRNRAARHDHAGADSVEDLDRDALVAELGRFTGATLVYANLDADWLDRMREALSR